MIKPTPYKLTCSDCGYSKVIAPKSDALMPHERGFSICPKCSGNNIQKNNVSMLGLLSSLF